MNENILIIGGNGLIGREIYKFLSKSNRVYVLDKKKINQYPRYIKLLGIGKTQISELRDFKKIIKTIKEVII